MATERGEISETNLTFLPLLVDSKKIRWIKRAKAAESINVEAKACFSERVRHIYDYYGCGRNSFFFTIIADKVAIRNKGRMIHDGNSGITAISTGAMSG